MILDYQRPAFEKLLAWARLLWLVQTQAVHRPRTNTLIIGPSGSGKTHLARAVANKLGAAFSH